MKAETCKLYLRVFRIFLPNVIKIDHYNSELYCYTVSKLVQFLRHTAIKRIYPHVQDSVTQWDGIIHYWNKKITMDIPEARSLKVTVTLLVESLVASLPGFTGRWSWLSCFGVLPFNQLFVQRLIHLVFTGLNY